MNKTKKILLFILALSLVSGLSYVSYRAYEDSQIEVVEQSSSPSASTQLDEPESTIVDGTNTDETGDIVSSGTFGSGDRDYSGSGTVSIRVDGDKSVVVFDDTFMVSSGPDLQVYISKNKVGSGEALGDFVSLGKLKKQSGSQSYNLPSDYEDYRSVVIWCRAFTAEFSSADLS